MIRAFSSVIKAEPVEVDMRLKEGDKVGRLTVIETSGHSEGSISLMDAERKTLFVGDALRFVDGKLREPPEHFNLDAAKARKL